MADRILTWHEPDLNGNHGRIGPTYYIESDYEPVAVRIQAVVAPDGGELEIDILDDGVSIFENRTSRLTNPTDVIGKTIDFGTPSTIAVLSKGENTEVDAETFITDLTIESGSWVYCEIVNQGDCRNVTVHLELAKLSDPEESDE